jgi:hypothetical protein
MAGPARPAALLLAALLAGCGDRPRSFREAGLPETERLLRDPSIRVVEALEGPARGFGTARGLRWRLDVPPPGGQPQVADGPVLVLGSSRDAGHRSAAALARAGHRPVWVFVPQTEEERAALAAPALEAKEKTRGEGS